MLRFFRLRYIALALLIWYGLTATDIASILRLPLETRARSFFTALGYPQAAFDITHATLSGATFENIVLDYDETGQDAINTIERIEIDYSPLDLLTGHIRRALVTNPNLFYSSEALPVLPNVSLDHASFLTDLPVDELEIDGLGLSYAGERFNPELSGKIVLNTGDDGAKRIAIALKGQQKDFSIDLKITGTENKNGPFLVDIDLADLRIDIQDTFKLSRGTGQFNLSIQRGLPVMAEGKFAAGAMRIRDIPFDHIVVSATGKKPSFAVIGGASVPDMPQTNLSLRITEDEKGAGFILQLAGEKPAEFFKRAGLTLNLPTQQKFSMLIDLKDKDIPALLSSPHHGGVFLYGDEPVPFIKARLSCPALFSGCTIDVPTALIPKSAFDKWFSPIFSDFGLSLSQGRVLMGARIAPLGLTQSPDLQFEGAFRDAAINWRGLSMSHVETSFIGQSSQTLQIGKSRANVLGGLLQTEGFVLSNDSKTRSGGLLSATGIDLAQLADFMRVKGLVLSGSLSGTVPFSIQGRKTLLLPEGELIAQKGTLQYTAKTVPSFLSGNDPRRVLIRDALRNYIFDELRLKIDGPVAKTITGRLTARGHSPHLYGDDPLHLDLRIDGPLAPSLVRVTGAP